LFIVTPVWLDAFIPKTRLTTKDTKGHEGMPVALRIPSCSFVPFVVQESDKMEREHCVDTKPNVCLEILEWRAKPNLVVWNLVQGDL
jgi:hypothetical protein